MKHFELKGQIREAGNKAVVKAFRKQGLVPCNLYGQGLENVLFTVSEKDLKGLTNTPASYIVDLVLSDGKTYNAIIHELQFHPVKDNCLHVDFLLVDGKKPVSINVPLVFTGHPIGVRQGGKFVQNARSLRISAMPDDLPDSLTIVTDNIVSDGLIDFINHTLGGVILPFKRGYKNVIDKGIELNSTGEVCELAIETSGHGAFRENYFSDDGAYIATKIICRMARLAKEGKPIASLIEKLGQPADAAEMRLTITEPDFKAYGQQVLEDFRAFCEADPRFHIVTPNYEGVRVAFDDEEVKGWLLIRLSLHDPVIPINLESKAPGGVTILKARIRPFIEAHPALKA